MNAAAGVPASPRRYLVQMDLPSSESVVGHLVTVIVAFLGGGLGVDAFRRWADRRKRLAAQPLEFTSRVLDEGDELRRRLLEEATDLRRENRQVLERAHRGELRLAVLEAEAGRLRIRLERKDNYGSRLRALLTEHGIPIPELPPAPGEEAERAGDRA